MPPKKGKKKGKKDKKEKPPPDPNLLTEVDKTFYELQITDLNRKLARLRSLTETLEEKNEELTKSLETLDQDRGDVITFLKRSLVDRSEEMKQLSEKLSTLQESKDTETEMYEQKIAELENEYRIMHETLTSEIKLNMGKLNSLEEFRLQKDELMKKFEEQEAAMEQQEMRHKREMYEIERKFIVGKDKLKKEMEARLLQLSTEFQDATEIRIAATTHRVIRENITINNELDSMMEAQNTLTQENQRYKERDRMLRQKAELLEAEKRKALAKARVQMGIVERLTNEHELMTKKLESYKDIEEQERIGSRELINAHQIIDNLKHHIKILEQNIQSLKCEAENLRLNLEITTHELHGLKATINEAKMSIKSTLKFQPEDEAERIAKKDNLLANLLELLKEAKKTQMERDSMQTVKSLGETYSKGDLGFIPQESKRIKYPSKKHRETQIGDSFHDMIREYNKNQLEMETDADTLDSSSHVGRESMDATAHGAVAAAPVPEDQVKSQTTIPEEAVAEESEEPSDDSGSEEESDIMDMSRPKGTTERRKSKIKPQEVEEAEQVDMPEQAAPEKAETPENTETKEGSAEKITEAKSVSAEVVQEQETAGED